MIRKWSRRVSICICGHSVKKPKANQRNKPKPEELIWSSIKNMLKYIVCTQHKLWMLLPQYSSIPSPLYSPRALSTGSFGEKNHFQAKKSPSICTAVRQSSAEKARRKPYRKAKIKTQPSPYLAFTEPLFGVSCQPLESFSVREQEIKAHGFKCVMCSSAVFQLQKSAQICCE